MSSKQETPDQCGLERFIEAQDPVFETVLDELRGGRKQTHWIWFIFPQVEGLGRSATARFFSIRSRGEAEAFLKHPLLGRRLRECVETVLAIEDRSAHAIFGSPDDLKFRSSMTLFGACSGGGLFQKALDRFFDGVADRETLTKLNTWDK